MITGKLGYVSGGHPVLRRFREHTGAGFQNTARIKVRHHAL